MRSNPGIRATRAAIAGLALAASPVGATDPPHVVAVVLDTSGSLRPADLARARALALGVLAALEPGSEVAVFTFDDESRLVLPRTSSPDEVRRALQGAGRKGRHTALHDALYDASRYLQDAPGAGKTILLLTDGRDEDSALDLDDGLKVAQDAGMRVFAVGLGQTEDRVLRRIAKLTGGQFALGVEARPDALAAQIRAVTAAAPAPAPPSPTARALEPKSSSSSASAAPDSVGGEHRTGMGGMAWAAMGLVAAAAAAGALLLAKRRNDGPRVPGAKPDLTLRGDLSPTLLSFLDTSGEPVDKTVTLRHRPVLTITKGPGQGQLFELNGESATSLGRARANDVVLPDVSVSSQHCRIRPEEGRYVLHDLQSTNGTFVNDKRVARHELTDGDVVQIGETYLEFRTERRRE
jgi:hypothetical protein